VLEALGASIPARAGAGGGGGGAAAGSIQVGLPGGGPTRAERRRDSVLNADVSARLERIRARIRARADSIAAADSAALRQP
jgi:hypothetical protein